MHDLSLSGAFLATEQPDDPGAQGTLTLSTYLSPEPIHIPCEVARVGEQPTRGMGLRFTHLEQSALRILKHYVSQFFGGALVCMVEDDPALLRLMERFMAKGGMSFVGLEPSANTAECLWRLRPHLIMLDIMMPQVSGFTLARELRERIAEASAQHAPNTQPNRASPRSNAPITPAPRLVFYSAMAPDLVPDDLRDIPLIPKGVSFREVVHTLKAQLPQGEESSPKLPG